MKKMTQPARVECVVSRKCRHEYYEKVKLMSGETQCICEDCGVAWRERLGGPCEGEEENLAGDTKTSSETV